MRLVLRLVAALFWMQVEIDMPAAGRIVVFGDVHLENDVRALVPPVPISLTEAGWENLRKKLAASPHWQQSDLSWVCCEPAGTAIVYIGVRATDRRPRVRPAPGGSLLLDPEDLAIYDRMMELNYQAVTARRAGPEGGSAGRSLSGSPPMRELEETIIARAGKRAGYWREVALTSSARQHRAAAIFLAAYGPKDQELADALADAAADPDSLVRNNAVRAIGVLARSPAGRSLRFNAGPLLDLFESVSWTDWNKASFALLALTEAANAKLLEEIAARASEPLRQIAGWPPMHAAPAIAILERIRDRKGP